MKTITTHLVPGAAGATLTVTALDQPGAGGAHHDYEIGNIPGPPLRLCFQNGPIAEQGVNGITQEALLAVVIDRLEGFQSGPFACAANARALKHARNALKALQERTRERLERGVEGRNLK